MGGDAGLLTKKAALAGGLLTALPLLAPRDKLPDALRVSVLDCGSPQQRKWIMLSTQPSPGGASGAQPSDRPPQQEIAERLLDWQQGRPRGPYTLELYPTLRCNLDCAFCDTTYRKKRAADELSRARYLALADEAAALEVRRCYILGGGEPMVAREITPDLMARLKSHGIYGILGSNGTLFSDPVIEQVVEMGWDELHLSLDGATAEVNDVLRGQRGVYQRVTEVTRRFNLARERRGVRLPRMLFHTVVTRLNYMQLEALVELAASLGCFRVNFDALIPYRPEQHALAMRPEERAALPRLAEQALKRAERLGLETSLEQFLSARALERGRMQFETPSTRQLYASPCLNPWHHIVVHHNGYVSPCCVIPSEPHSDEVKTRSLREVWFEGAYFQGLRRSFQDKLLTRHCPNCSMSIIGQNDDIRARMERLIPELVETSPSVQAHFGEI